MEYNAKYLTSLRAVMVRTFNITNLVPEYGLLTTAYDSIRLPTVLTFIFGMHHYIGGLPVDVIKL